MERAATVTDDYEVAAALRVAIGLLVRKLRQAHLPGELTIAETSALSRLDRGGPATSSDMAKQDRISPQSMGATLSALEGRGLVQRAADPQDGRQIVLSLSNSGRQTLRDKRSARTAQLAQALQASFTQPELDVLAAAAPLLERLAQNI